MRYTLLLTVLAVLACGSDPTSPGNRVLPVGSYQYSMTDPRPGGPTHSGQLIITAATPEQLEGSWSVTGYQPGLLGGGWNLDAYIPMANKVGGGSVNHRIRRQGSGYHCEATIIELSGGNLTSIPIGCTLTGP